MPSKQVTFVGILHWDGPLDAGAHPEHPIVLPPNVTPPPSGGGHPEHPIYWPPHPAHPIVIPPMPPVQPPDNPPAQPPGTVTHPIVGPGGMYYLWWSPIYGWVAIPVGGGANKPEQPPSTDNPHPEHPIVLPSTK